MSKVTQRTERSYDENLDLSNSFQLMIIFPSPLYYITDHTEWKILLSRETVFIKKWFIFSFINKSKYNNAS